MTNGNSRAAAHTSIVARVNRGFLQNAWRRVGVREESLAAYLMILPASLTLFGLLLYPLGDTFVTSFLDWNGLSPQRRFIGLDNYARLFTDNIFHTALRNNVVWGLSAMVFPVTLGLVLAWIIYNRPRGARFFRILFFLPYILPIVALGLAWNLAYHPTYGLINAVLKGVGATALVHAWLGESSTALGAVFGAWAWHYYGFCMVLFLASLQNIPAEILEAARIDGASGLQQFLHVSIPMMKGPITVIMVITLIASFRVFDIVFVMTSAGPGHASEVITFMVYREAFIVNDVGYAATLAVVLLAIVLTTSLGMMRLIARGGEI